LRWAGHIAYIVKQEILVGTLSGKKLHEGSLNIWMDGLILKCMFETEVTNCDGSELAQNRVQ